jgi:hypothetical protein
MSEIRKYQMALRHRTNPRYLTRDFIVPLYTGTEPDILDDSNTQQEAGSYTPFPNDMPIVSPKEIQNQPYEQLQLNEGGRVNFKRGGKVIENNYLFNFMKQNQGTSNFEKAKKLNKLGFTNSQGGKITDSYLEKFITQNQELKGLGARSAAFTLDEVKQYARPKQLQDFESGLIDEQTFRTRVNQYRGDLKKTPEQKILNAQKTYERIMADPERKAKKLEAATRYNEKKYLEKGMYPPAKNPKDALWRDLLRSADVDDRVSLVGKRPNKYPRDVFQSIKLKDNETGKIISYKNLDKHPEYNKAIKPYQIKFAINQFELSPETRKKITYQRAEGGNKSNIVIQHNQGLGKNPFNTSLAIQGENIQESLIRDRFEKRFNAAETLSDKKQAINLFKKDLENKAPNIVSQPGKKAYGVETDVEGLLKTSKVPAGERRRLVQMIGSIGCPTYAVGGRVSFSDGSDCFNKGLKALEEGNLTKPQLNVAARAIAESGEEGMLLKNLLNKAGSGIKFTGKGIGELVSIGTGPIGVGLGAAVETAFAAPYILEGDYKQALRQSIFGQVPSWLGVDVGSRDEDIIKGAKEAGVDPDSVKKYVELKKNYIENEEYGQKLNMLDTMYKRDPKNPDYAEQIRRLENKIKPSADYLEKTVYAPKDLDKIEKDYLKAANYFVQKNAAQAPFTRSEEQQKSSLKDIVEESTSAIREPQDVQTILTREKLLPQEQKQIELPNVVSPDDYINELQQYNAGGRVGFKDGSGPKLSRRGFLGFLAGAAAAPFAGKLIKGEKAALQGTKVAAKILPKAAGMPEWFPSLVARIEKEGKDISVPVKNLEDKIVTKRLEIPVAGEKEPDIVIMHQHPDGSIQIEADVYGGSFDSPFELHYKPPKSDIDLETGKAINDPGEFNVLEQRPRPVGWEGSDLEIDYEYMSPKDAISDIERVEKIATGKRIHPKRVNERTAARKVVEERPYEDVINRYPDPDTGGDWWER